MFITVHRVVAVTVAVFMLFLLDKADVGPWYQVSAPAHQEVRGQAPGARMPPLHGEGLAVVKASAVVPIAASRFELQLGHGITTPLGCTPKHSLAHIH